MPIKEITSKRRLPRQGKLRLGIMKISPKSKKEYPSEAGQFIIDPEGDKAEAIKTEFTRIYGPEPRTIDIMFPVSDPEVFFPQWYKAYKGKKGAGYLACKGDGETAIKMGDAGMVDCKCKGEDCPEYIGKKCRRVAILQVLLPMLSGIGVYQISTTSRNSIINLNSSVDYISALCGRIAMIPLKLTLTKQDVQMPGSGDGPKMSKHWILGVDADLADIQRTALVPETQVFLPAPDETRDPLLHSGDDVDKPELKEPQSFQESAAEETKENVAKVEKEEIDKKDKKTEKNKAGVKKIPGDKLLARIEEYRVELGDDMFHDILRGGWSEEEVVNLDPAQRADFAGRLAATVKDLKK